MAPAFNVHWGRHFPTSYYERYLCCCCSCFTATSSTVAAVGYLVRTSRVGPLGPYGCHELASGKHEMLMNDRACFGPICHSFGDSPDTHNDTCMVDNR
jgi:hypothetical protein